MSKTKPFDANRCPNCGEYGPHFVPPSFGEPGFFICEKKIFKISTKTTPPLDSDAKELVQVS